MRQLKYHESKLLRKVNLYAWKGDSNIRVAKILRRYHIQNREDYVAYERICGHVTSLASKLKTLANDDPFRIAMTEQLLTKLTNLAVIDSASSLEKATAITVSSFCRRRLPVIMVRLKMAETVKLAVTLIEQGHIRVGPNVVTDPSFLVSRALEDFVTWVDSSKIKRAVVKYNGKLDDFDLLE
jgi:U3 small nucleolar ribonucleoprotein protein IMP3